MKIFNKYASALRGIFSGVPTIAAFWEALIFPRDNILLPISLRFPESIAIRKSPSIRHFVLLVTATCVSVEHWWNDTDKANTEILWKNHVPLPIVHQKKKGGGGAWTDLGSNVGPQGYSSVTNSLNHDTDREKMPVHTQCDGDFLVTDETLLISCSCGAHTPDEHMHKKHGDVLNPLWFIYYNERTKLSRDLTWVSVVVSLASRIKSQRS